ncbi:unnamed protein product [Orchesella dallaii]|uniref:Uncharacterized protein n=1 Tax=Orchesella dallaii TaxID=48710 RepID=A0ABP1RR85_9HEXA
MSFLFLKSVAQISASVLNSGMDCLVLTLSFTVYQFTTITLKDVENMKEKNIMKVAKQLETYFTLFNDFASQIVLWWFCMGLPWIPARMIENLPGINVSSIATCVYIWASIALYVVFMFLFAETRRKIETFRNLACRRFLENSAKDMSSLVKISLQNAVVQGGPFFQITYGFMGSIFGVMVAYGFLALQLRIGMLSYKKCV